jgi:hypothetical protein
MSKFKIIEDLLKSLDEKVRISDDAYTNGLRFILLQRIGNLEKYLEKETKEIKATIDDFFYK